MTAVSPLATIGAPDPQVLAARLPEAARAHFRRLVSLPAELRAQAGFHQNARLDAIDAAQHADREIARLRGATPSDPRLRQHTETRITALAAEAERHRADAAACEARAAPLRERANAAGHLAEALIAFVAAAEPGTLRLAKAPDIPKGATLEAVRGQIADLARQLEATRLAPYPRAVTLERLAAEIDALAARGAPRIDPRRAHAPARLADAVDPAGPFLVWLLADTIKSRLAEAVPDDPNALTDAERARRLADLARRRLDLERIEEQIARQHEAEGRQIDRRPGADPRAVLQIDGGGQ